MRELQLKSLTKVSGGFGQGDYESPDYDGPSWEREWLKKEGAGIDN